ncbi:hypothetical protein AAMO2058_001352900 [Amorphochlora amoebiformis]
MSQGYPEPKIPSKPNGSHRNRSCHISTTPIMAASLFVTAVLRTTLTSGLRASRSLSALRHCFTRPSSRGLRMTAMGGGSAGIVAGFSSSSAARGNGIEPPQKIEFFYFPVRARMENLRMMLHYARVDYVDIIVGGQTYRNMKAQGVFPFQTLPTVTLTFKDGKEVNIGQSGSITRYMAKLGGMDLYPSDPLECAIVDQVYQYMEDAPVFNPVVNVFTGEKFKERKSAFLSHLPTRLNNVRKFLGSGPFFAERKNPSYADFHVYHMLSQAKLLDPKCLDGDKQFQEFMKTVESLPRVSEYLKTRVEAIDIGTNPMLDPRPEIGSSTTVTWK